jgi:Do/DeqQ family serine protease
MTSKASVTPSSDEGGLALASRLFHVCFWAYMNTMIKHLIIASTLIFAPAAVFAPAFAQDADLAGPPDRLVPESQSQVQLSFAPIVREAAPAVVNVYSRRAVSNRSRARDPFFQRFLGRQPQEQNSLGSGVIVDPSGVIVTNHHVVVGSTELRVVLADRREYSAVILLTDEATDLAVLKVETDEPLPTMPFDMTGDSEVGDLVLAIGNPFGVGQTVTSGIVSALARTDVGQSNLASFIQTDAAINPGNSGGALVDMEGELIGVNTMIFSRSGGSHGIGFAIPAEMVRRVVDSALTESELIRPWLGARLQPVTGDLAEAFGLDRPRGAVVNEIYPGGAAATAGLRQGDVVLGVDGVDINDESGARFRLATHAAGEEARFTVLRAGERVSLDVPVQAAPGEVEPQRLQPAGRNPLVGANLVALSPAFNETVGIDPFLEGVVVAGVQRRSIASRFGFRAGDRLVELMGQPVVSTEGLEATLAEFDSVQQWPVVIERRGQRMDAVIELY